MESGRSTKRLHELDAIGEDLGLVGKRHARVDVEHVRAGRDLGQRVPLHPRIVARRQLRHQQLAAGGIDPLADDAEGLVEADHHLPGGGTDDGSGHGASQLSPAAAAASMKSASSP